MSMTTPKSVYVVFYLSDLFLNFIFIFIMAIV